MLEVLLRHRRPILVLLLVLQPLILILSGRESNQPKTGIVGGTIFQGIGAIQNGMFQSIGGIGDLWNKYLRLVEVNEENERLRTELARLQEERVRLLGIMQENARLRTLLGFRESAPELELRPARVIAKDITSFFRVVRLRLEVGEGVARPQMPVVARSGLVGQVTTVNGDYCDVLLTVDAQSRIDVLIQRNRARGILYGNGHEDDYTGRVAYLLQRDEVQVGDVVVTSGEGGRFPGELVVGHIQEVIESTTGMYQEVVVRPSVDFSRLEEVFLITNFEGMQWPQE
jgi:rod shape-determining protein MreC